VALQACHVEHVHKPRALPVEAATGEYAIEHDSIAAGMKVPAQAEGCSARLARAPAMRGNMVRTAVQAACALAAL